MVLKETGSEAGIAHPEIVETEQLRLQALALTDNFHPGPRAREIKLMTRNLTGSANPHAALEEMSLAELAGRLSQDGFQRAIPDSLASLSEYLNPETPTWLDQTQLLSKEAKEHLRQHPIVSFTLEIAIDTMPQIYSGGLGMLNGDDAREGSDMGIPTAWVSLLYKGGYFKQEFDAQGNQQEVYLNQSGDQYPMDEARGKEGNPIGLVSVPMGKDHTVFAKVWEVKLGRNKLYLLDTDVPENNDEADRWITGHLYSKASTDTSIRQETLLALGGIRALDAMGIEPSVYHLQEGHAAFAPLEAMAQLVEQGMSLEQAGMKVSEKTVFTNHTIVVHDFFEPALIDSYLSSVAQRMGVTTEDLYSLGADEKGRFSMTQLALNIARRTNGVSKLHAEVLRREFPGYPIEAVTNGVHVETWLGEPMGELFDRYLGSNWREKDDPFDFEKIREIPDEEYWQAKQKQKGRLFDYIKGKYGIDLSLDTLTACVARRFAMYKRNTLIARDADRLATLVNDEKYPMQILIGGKAHPSDKDGKGMIREFNNVIKDPRLQGRVIVLSDYDMDLAHHLVGGVDLWMNTPRRGLEASGTSGMKAGDNGTLQLTVIDGWADEVDWSNKGWPIGEALKGAEIVDEEKDRQEADELYNQLTYGVGPTYYEDRTAWINRMKETQIHVLQQFSTRRMKEEQVKIMYADIIEEQARQATLAA